MISIDNKICTSNNGLMVKDDYVTKNYLDEKFESFKSELYDIKDEIITELKKNRENDDTHQFSHMRVNDDLQDLDKRVTKLEKQPS